MIDELEFDKHYEKDFELLIKAAIEIGNSLDGRKTSIDKPHIYYVEGLGQKILSHILSANYLSKGYKLTMADLSFEPQIDFSSITILARAALESYLTFNYIFASTKDDDELSFRFNCWHLGGFIDRSEFVPKTEKHTKLKEYEAEQVIKIQNLLREIPLFNRLNSGDKAAALKGKWKLSKSWSKLAVNARFGQKFFEDQYSFLCSHAHASRLSTMQVQQTKELTDQAKMAKSTIGILMIILAKFMFDYIHLIPELNHFVNDRERYPIILTWKTIGESV